MTLAAEPSAAIEVRDLTVSVRGRRIPVVADISFSIPAGRIMGLVGETGSGKSTAGLALLGFARPGLEITSGSARIGDVDVLALDEPGRRRVRGRLVSYVPQDPASGLNPAHRVGAQVCEALSVHREDLDDIGDLDEHVRQLLEDVRLPTSSDLLRSYPHQLSGGQQQRIGIAMAFACRPRLLVLDEPTTGLDVTTQRHILETINALADRYDVSAVYISHDLATVGQIAAETAVMYAGRIIEHAPTHELYADPRHPYTGGLLAAAPSPERPGKLVGIEGHPPRPGRWPEGCAYVNRCPRSTPECVAALPKLAPMGPGRLARCIHPLPSRALAESLGVPAPAPSVQRGDALTVRNLTAHYGRQDVLHNVDLDVSPGRCTAVVGESGSGKTTLARCLVGLHSRWDGEISLHDSPLACSAADRDDEHRRRIQYIFQNPYASLNPTMTVAENVEEPLRHFERLSAADRRARALDVLDAVALGRDFADRLPGRLSGGERQRVAVGRALIANPSILVCDEITSALDVSVQALLVEQLRDLQLERGLSMVFITHNLAVVRNIAQTVVVLEQGTVVETGTVDEVLGKPQHRYTRQLLEDLPRLEEIEIGAAS